ncbi:nucleotidyltransferase domain-containing protein [Candidatus Woesearchaeota archaeon]|nr:nucleotidyltransferase domain-containing protein [Candidatus Woesearchaeota archaeon]
MCKEHLNENLSSVVLFGSAVSSAAQANDYDLLIITKKKIQKEWQLAGKIKADLKTDKPVDVVIMEEEDFKYPGPLVYEVCHKHRLLYGKNILPTKKAISKLVKPLFERGVKVGWKVAQ